MFALFTNYGSSVFNYNGGNRTYFFAHTAAVAIIAYLVSLIEDFYAK